MQGLKSMYSILVFGLIACFGNVVSAAAPVEEVVVGLGQTNTQAPGREVAVNTPTTGGIERSNTGSGTTSDIDTRAVTRTSFEYVTIPDPSQPSGEKLAKAAFDAFIKDDRNAGILVPFLINFDVTSLNLLKRTIFRADSNFWKEMEKIGASREALEKARKKLWAKQDKKYQEVLEHHEALRRSTEALPSSAEVQGELKKIEETVERLKREHLESFRLTLKAVEDELDTNFMGLDSSKYKTLLGWISDKLQDLNGMNGSSEGMNFKNIVIIEENGQKVQRNIFQELNARTRYINRFARAAGKSSPDKYGLAYVLSWVFTERNIDLAIEQQSGDSTPGDDDDEQTPPSDDDSSTQPPSDGTWNKANTEIYNTLARAMGEKVSFTVGTVEKQGPLASGFIRMEKFYGESVEATEQNVLGTFRTELKEKILADPEFKNFGGEKYSEAVRLGEEFEGAAETVERYKALKAETAKELKTLLNRFSPETNLESLIDKSTFQSLMEKMALGGASRNDVTRFTSLVKNYTQYNLHLAFAVNDAAQKFIKVYELYKDFKKVNIARRNNLVKWIQEFDSKRNGRSEEVTEAARAEAKEYCQSTLEKHQIDPDLNKLKDQSVLREAVNKMEARGITEAEIAKFARSFKMLSGLETQGASSELPSYGNVMKYLVGYVQEKNAEKLNLLNTPFNAMSAGKCLSLLPNETEANLKITSETEPGSLVTEVTEDLNSLNQRQLLCYAAYEWAMKERAKENGGKDFIFSVTNEPEKEFDITLGTIFRFMGEEKQSVRDPQATDHSIYEGFSELMDLINNLQDLIIAHLKREFSKRGVNLENVGDGMRVQSTDFSSVTFRIPSKILFDQGKDTLKDEGKAVLEKVVPILLTVLSENQMLIKDLTIEGHANSDPYPGYSSRHTNRIGNDGLSDDRAISVYDYWNSEHASGAVPSFTGFQQSSGVLVNRVGKGTSELVMKADGNEDKALSRRTVLKFRLDSEKIAALKNQPEKLRALKKRLQDAENEPPQEDQSDSDEIPVPPIGDPDEDDDTPGDQTPPPAGGDSGSEGEATPPVGEESGDETGAGDEEEVQTPDDSSQTPPVESEEEDGGDIWVPDDNAYNEALIRLHEETFAPGTKIYSHTKYGGHMGRYWEGVKINGTTSERLKKIYAQLQAHGNAEDTMVKQTLEDIGSLYRDVDPKTDTLLDGKDLSSFRCRKEGQDCEVYTRMASVEANVKRLTARPSTRNEEIQTQRGALFADGNDLYKIKKYVGHAGRYHQGVSVSEGSSEQLKKLYVSLQQLPEKDPVVQALIADIADLYVDAKPGEDDNLADKQLRSFRCKKNNQTGWENCEIYQKMKAISDRSLRI